MRTLWIVAGLAVFLGCPAYPQTSLDQPLSPQACRDGNFQDRCTSGNFGRVLGMFAMASAEAEAEAGVEAYRVFYLDAFGEKKPPVVFERRVGAPPKVVVYGRTRKIEAPATVEAWERVRARSEFADRALAPLPPGEDFPSGMCTDAGAVTVEIINAPHRRQRAAPIRSRTENTCGPGLTETFAFELVDLALDQFPTCKALIFGDAVDRLAFCTTLQGDTIAAVDLVNEIGADGPQRGDFESAGGWAMWIGVNAAAELDWAGQVTKDAEWNGDRVATFLAARSAEAYVYLQPETIEGLSSQSVRVRGRIYILSDKDRTRQGAAYEQAWVWDTAAKEWMLKSWKVEAFAPEPDRG